MCVCVLQLTLQSIIPSIRSAVAFIKQFCDFNQITVTLHSTYTNEV